MILKDHINLPGLAGQHPLKGPNDHRFGGRFFALNDSYDKSFRTYAKDVAKELNLQDRVHEGVYAMLGGPNFGELKCATAAFIDRQTLFHLQILLRVKFDTLIDRRFL